jgi:uncharacterized protein
MRTAAAVPYLADVNVLVALLHERHAKTAQTVAWLEGQEQSGIVALCRVVQMGVLRVLTNPAWLKDEVLTAAAVWQGWDRLLSDERFTRVDEPAGLEREWRTLTGPFAAGRCAETDTYLAAFARAGGYRLLTFDQGFARLKSVDALVLQ